MDRKEKAHKEIMDTLKGRTNVLMGEIQKIKPMEADKLLEIYDEVVEYSVGIVDKTFAVIKQLEMDVNKDIENQLKEIFSSLESGRPPKDLCEDCKDKEDCEKFNASLKDSVNSQTTKEILELMNKEKKCHQ